MPSTAHDRRMKRGQNRSGLLTRRTVALSLAAIAIAKTSPSVASEPVRIAAAANLRGALEAILARFEATRPSVGRPRFSISYGSSGNHARQIEQGAPFALFLSADDENATRLVNAGLTENAGLIYAVGRLVLITPRNHPAFAGTGGSTLDKLPSAIAAGQVQKFAIANPEHAPYGARARELLQSLSVWQSLQGRLVMGENVSQTGQFVASGGADAGLVAASLMHLPELAAKVTSEIIPADRHTPLLQRAVVMRSAPPIAEQLLRYLGEPDAQSIFQDHGFDSPGK
jgi:molybdate transport system substrate-binding protein